MCLRNSGAPARDEFFPRRVVAAVARGGQRNADANEMLMAAAATIPRGTAGRSGIAAAMRRRDSAAVAGGVFQSSR
jgi:hypothetical protein